MASPYIRKDSPFIHIHYRDTDGTIKNKKSPFRHSQMDEAQALCREIEKQTAKATATTGPITVAEWAAQWFVARAKKIASEKDDRSRITTHVLPAIGAIELAKVRKSDVQSVFDALRAKHEATGKPASGTIKSIHAAVKVMFSDAVAAELIPASPLHLSSHTLPSVHKTARLPYTLAEIEQVLTAPADTIPDDRRTLYGILFFCGLRFGEGAALKWSDYDTAAEPLPRMDIVKAYSVRRKTVGRTKTETKRPAPVHPIFRALLEQWRTVGFPALFGRAPTADDLIVPSREGKCRSSNHGMKRLRQDLGRLGMPQLELRTQHAFRTSYISQMRAADVDKDKVRAVTHGKRSSGDVIDAFYTVWPWEILCQAVMQMPLSISLRSVYGLPSYPESLRKSGGVDGTRILITYETETNRTLNLQHYSQPTLTDLSRDASIVGSLSTVEPTSFTTLPTELPEAPEAMSYEEILQSLQQARHLAERARVNVFCETCLHVADVEEAPNMWECIYCGAEAAVQVG